MIRIITGDETWVHHYEPETKRQGMQWKHASSSSKKFKSQPSAGKLMLTVFWDSQGPILEHYMEKGVTVTSVNYCNMLRNELRPAIRSKRRGRLTQGVLLHDNARPHRHTSSSTPFGNCIGKFSSTLPTPQTWPLQISICLDPSRTL